MLLKKKVALEYIFLKQVHVSVQVRLFMTGQEVVSTFLNRMNMTGKMSLQMQNGFMFPV